MLQTFDSDITHFDVNNPYVRGPAGDDKLPCQFYMGAIRDDAASEKEGRPIYRDEECIRIFNSKDNIIDRPVRDTDKARWPGKYAAWKQTGVSEAGAAGTRLENWPAMTRAQAEEFKYFKVFTVEQLAELPDSVAQKIMGAAKLKQMAKLTVEAARGEEPFRRMQADSEKKDGEISFLKAEVERLSKLMEEKLAAPA